MLLLAHELALASQIWVVTFEQGPTIIGICDDSGEDPTCHNSVCYLGLCTSIADHMEYLGAHMYHRCGSVFLARRSSGP